MKKLTTTATSTPTRQLKVKTNVKAGCTKMGDKWLLCDESQ